MSSRNGGNEATNGAKRASTRKEYQSRSVTKGTYYETNTPGTYTRDKNRAKDKVNAVRLNSKLNSDGSPKNFSIKDNGDISIKKVILERKDTAEKMLKIT